MRRRTVAWQVCGVRHGGRDQTGELEQGLFRRPLGSGARQFLLDDLGEAFRYDPARRYKVERMGSFLEPSFRLAARPGQAAGAAAQRAPEVASASDAAPLLGGSPIAAAKLRPMDRAILELVARPTHANLEDVFPDRPYEVNLYRDGVGSTIDRVKIDLDRDGTWDEMWSVEGDDIRRQVAPDDDERYTRSTRLHADAWVAEKSP
jgi:hypothetical protein